MSQEMDEVISSAFETKVVFKVMDCEPFTILIEFMESGRKVTKCTLCLTRIFSANKKSIVAHLTGFKHKKKLKLIQRPESNEKAETISELKKRLEMFERLDVCIKNEIQSLRIEVSQEIKDACEVRGGLEMTENPDVPVNNEINFESQIEVQNEIKEEMEV